MAINMTRCRNHTQKIVLWHCKGNVVKNLSRNTEGDAFNCEILKKKVENRVTRFFSLKIACEVSEEEV